MVRYLTPNENCILSCFNRATQEALGGLEHYVGIDSRAGLTELAQELVKASKRKSSTKLSFVKRWGRVSPIPLSNNII